MIQVKKMSVQKGQRMIIEDISFRIEPGEIVVVIGKNGAGKTTLLEALTRSNNISQGNISWDGVPYKKLGLTELAKRRAVLSQSVNIDFPVKVKELVVMGTYVSDEPLPNIKIESLVREALAAVEMQGFSERAFNTLSGGEQKRVLFAKCIVQLNCCDWANNHKYLFLDEPTSSLDIEQQFKLIASIKHIARRRKIGVFAVLHDINLAAQFADKILIMNSGRLLHQGSPKEMIRPDLLRETMGIHSIVQTHPVFDCPYVTTLPHSVGLTA